MVLNTPSKARQRIFPNPAFQNYVQVSSFHAPWGLEETGLVLAWKDCGPGLALGKLAWAWRGGLEGAGPGLGERAGAGLM